MYGHSKVHPAEYISSVGLSLDDAAPAAAHDDSSDQHGIAKLPPARGATVIVAGPTVSLPRPTVIPLSLPADYRDDEDYGSPTVVGKTDANAAAHTLEENDEGVTESKHDEVTFAPELRMSTQTLTSPRAPLTSPSTLVSPRKASVGTQASHIEDTAEMERYRLKMAKEYAKKDKQTRSVAPTSVRHYGIMSKLRDAHHEPVTAVAFSDDEALLASGSNDGLIVVWDVDNQRVIRYLDNHVGTVFSLQFAAFEQSYRLMSCAKDKTVKIWDIESGTCMATMRDHGNNAMHAALWSSDGSMMATTGRSRHILVYNLARAYALELNLNRHSRDCIMVDIKPKSAESPAGHSDSIKSLLWAHDNFHIFSASDDGTIKMWNIPRGGECVRTFAGHEGKVNAIALDADGERLVSCGVDGTLRIWNVESGALIRKISSAHSGPVVSVVFSPEGRGRRIVSIGEEGLACWEAHTGLLMSRLDHIHTGGVKCLAIRSDGRCVITGGGDRLVAIWRALPPPCCGSLAWDVYSSWKSTSEWFHNKFHRPEE